MSLPAPLETLASREDGYQIKKELGEGTYGTVFMAVEVRSGRRVAIKYFNAQADFGELDGTGAHEFEMQRRAYNGSAATRHFVRPIYYELAPLRFLVMGWIPQSVTLGALIHGRHAAESGKGLGLKPQVALPILIRALEAIEDLHSKGIIHGDIKPENYQVSRRAVTLLDFGLAVLESEAEARRKHPDIIGTLDFVSPEYVLGTHYDFREDLWAMGVMTHFVLMGRKPFYPESPRFPQVDFKEAGKEIEIPELDVDLAAVIRKALHPQRSQRYQTASEFLVALRECARSRGIIDTGP